MKLKPQRFMQGYSETIGHGTLGMIGLTAIGAAKLVETSKSVEEIPIPPILKAIAWYVFFAIGCMTLILKVRELFYISKPEDDEKQEP